MPRPPADDHVIDPASRKAAQRGIRNRALTIGMSVVPFGLSFGAVSVETHLSLLQVCLLSLVLFSGASQFALVSVISGGGSYLSAVGTALLLGARNGLYGVRINALFHPRGWRRLLMAETTIDESTAMAVSEATSGFALRAFWTTALSVYVLWNMSTIIGALCRQCARISGDRRARCAGPAAFTALLAPRSEQPAMRSVALASGAIALATVSLCPSERPILIGGLGAVALLLVIDR